MNAVQQCLHDFREIRTDATRSGRTVFKTYARFILNHGSSDGNSSSGRIDS